MTLQELVLALSEECFSETLLPSADGRYEFVCDDMSIVLAPNEAGDAALLAATLPNIEEAWKPKIAQFLLEMNYLFKGGNGSVFSVDPTTKAFMLQKTLRLDSSREALLEEVARFLTRVERCGAFLCYPQEESESPKTSAEKGVGTVDDAVMNANWIAV